MFSIIHVSWWIEELRSDKVMAEGVMNLEKNDFQVDYVITHSPYTSVLRQMDLGSGVYKSDKLTDYLQQIKDKVIYQKWFFGHMHVNQNFPEDNAIAIYEQIIRIL